MTWTDRSEEDTDGGYSSELESIEESGNFAGYRWELAYQRRRKLIIAHRISSIICDYHGGHTVPHVANLIVSFIWNDKVILHLELGERHLEFCAARRLLVAFERNQ